MRKWSMSLLSYRARLISYETALNRITNILIDMFALDRDDAIWEAAYMLKGEKVFLLRGEEA